MGVRAWLVLGACWVVASLLAAAVLSFLFALRDERRSLDDELAHWEAEREARRERERHFDDWPRVH